MIHLLAINISALCLGENSKPLNVLVFSKTVGFGEEWEWKIRI
jgi:hypothetical protein